jgi:predicted nuclease of restriction endonuclease-like (RecB) superfamily
VLRLYKILGFIYVLHLSEICCILAPYSAANSSFMLKEDKFDLSQASTSDILGYDDFLSELKTRISDAQIPAAVAVNKELVLLYWQIGQDILASQQQQGWGAKVINRLATDLQQAFPEIKGFSLRNLKYMRAFAQAYPDEQFVQLLAAQIPWGHNIALLEKLKLSEERFWYAQQTIQYSWSRNVLVHQIESQETFHRNVSTCI